MGRLFGETMFQLDEHDSLIPDISVVFAGRIAPGSSGWIQGAPEIATEIVSSETAAALERKIDLYLAHGGKSVWVVFPEQRLVRIFDAANRATKYEEGQTLDDPSVLSGFSTPVSAIFEGI